MQATTTSATASGAVETKATHTLYAYAGTLNTAADKRESKSVLRVPVQYVPKEFGDSIPIGSILEKTVSAEQHEQYKRPFDRMLSRIEGDGGFEKIPDFFFDYTIERTETDIIFKALFENVCRIALAEYYNSLFPSTHYKLMMKRAPIEYNSYKRVVVEETIDDIPSLDIFGNGDMCDY